MCQYKCRLKTTKTYLRDISRYDSRLSEEVQYVVQPWRQMGLAVLCKIHTSDRAQLDAKRLEKDCKDVGHQHDEKQLELE